MRARVTSNICRGVDNITPIFSDPQISSDLYRSQRVPDRRWGGGRDPPWAPPPRGDANGRHIGLLDDTGESEGIGFGGASQMSERSVCICASLARSLGAALSSGTATKTHRHTLLSNVGRRVPSKNYDVGGAEQVTFPAESADFEEIRVMNVRIRPQNQSAVSQCSMYYASTTPQTAEVYFWGPENVNPRSTGVSSRTRRAGGGGGNDAPCQLMNRQP